MIDRSANWAVLSQRPGTLAALVRMFYGTESNSVSLGTRRPKGIGEKFLGVIKSVPKLIQSLDFKTHEYSVGDLMLLIENLEFQPGKRWSDIVEALGTAPDIGFYNRKINLRLFLEGNTSFADGLSLMESGIIRDIKHDRMATKIKIEDNTKATRIDLTSSVNEDDAPDGFELPSASLGLKRPIIYGDHRLHINKWRGNTVAGEPSRPNTNWTPLRKNTLTPMIDLGGDNWLIADHIISSLSDSNEDAIWGWDSEIKRYVELRDFSIVENDHRGCIISKDGTTFWDYRVPISVSDPSPAEFVNSTNLVDRDRTTAATATIPNGTGHPTRLSVVVNFPAEDIIIGTVSSRHFLMEYDLDASWAGEAFIDLDTGGDFQRGDAGGDAQFRRSVNGNQAAASVDLGFKTVGPGNTTAERVLTCREVAMKVTYVPAFSPQLFFGGKGMPYGLEINDRAVGDGFTEEHEDHDEAISKKSGGDGTTSGSSFSDVAGGWVGVGVASGDILEILSGGSAANKGRYIVLSRDTDTSLSISGTFPANAISHAWNIYTNKAIENFAGEIESVGRIFLGLGDSEIDEDSFNIASNDIPTSTGSPPTDAWLCNTGLSTAGSALELLFSIARDCRSLVWWTQDGTLRMKTILDSYAASDLTVDAREIKKLDFDRTPIRDILTAVNVRFGQTEARGVGETGLLKATINQTKYNITEAQSALVHEAINIGTNATAVLLRAYLLAQNKEVHNIILGELGKAFLHLDMGDVIGVTNLPYNPYGEDVTANFERTQSGSPLSGQTIFKFFWLFHTERGEMLKFKAIQLHDLTP